MKFINIPAPIMSEEYSDGDFPIVDLEDGKLIYNGEELK